jgi:hypothetical protein
MADSPLGKREDSRLEFKGRDALKSPEKIAREVVALLNADGGEVWVGIREEGGRAVAVEPIEKVEVEQRRLHDYLIDKIEPSMTEAEVKVKVQEVEEEGRVLRVTVQPEPSRRPYAFLERGARLFVIRVGDRIRPMEREEILRTDGRGQGRLNEAMQKVLRERGKLQSEGEDRFWLRLEPEEELDLKINERMPEFEEYLQQPQRTGNRLSGRSFADFQRRPELKQDRLVLQHGPRSVEIRRSGAITFTAYLAVLSKGDHGVIWPDALLEYTVSGLRIARAVYQDHIHAGGRVVADLALFNVRSWKLLATPGRWQDPRAFTEADDFLLEKPLVFRAEEIRDEPDRCGIRLIERVYEAFGFPAEALPPEVDRQSGRLVLPE